MKVHIVHHDDGWIVPAMAEWLAERNGWSIGTDVRNDVDLNYFMPYTAYRPAETLTAAWFTHYENEWNAAKGALWLRASDGVDLRIVTTDVYLTRVPGWNEKTKKVTAGIDLDFFGIARRPYVPGRIAVVGIGQPRKGPDLLVKLFIEGYDVRVYGTGWSFRSTPIAYENMPAVYAETEILVCTSLAEAIPIPPLEALASGRKVVVPSGVGLLDELKEGPGVRHYEAGNENDLVEAVERAFSDGVVHPYELRKQIERYSIDNWASSTESVFSAAFKEVRA